MNQVEFLEVLHSRRNLGGEVNQATVAENVNKHTLRHQ